MIPRLATFSESKQANIIAEALLLFKQYRYISILGAIVCIMDELDE